MSIEDIARELYQAFNDRAVDQYAHRYYHPDCVLVDGPTGQESYGPEGIIQNANMWTTAFPDGSATVVEVNVSGNVVTTIFRGRGTFTGELMTPDGNIPGNGKALDLEFEDILEFEDDLVVRNETHYDMQEMMRQLGLG